MCDLTQLFEKLMDNVQLIEVELGRVINFLFLAVYNFYATGLNLYEITNIVQFIVCIFFVYISLN